MAENTSEYKASGGSLRIGIDAGGTFTDFVLRDDASGGSWFAKTLSTPGDPARAALEGLDRLASVRPFRLAEIGEIRIATTVATNAILERKGGRTALVTTRGFRDVLIMGRSKRFDTYDLWLDKPRPLVPRRAIFEVDERIGPDGEVLRPLDPRSVAAAAERVAAAGAESVAVCLLHAYANPAHERAAGELLAEHLGGPPRNRAVSISLSTDVSPRRREYERTSTVVANAYVKPIVGRFLAELEAAFASLGFTGELRVMQSNGGLTTSALARAYPVNIIESGPAAGVLACRATGMRESVEHLITFDMGGTTAKVGVIDGGEPAVTSTFEVDGVNLRKWSGLPIDVPSVELVEIGAGGGSIASAELGVVAVGPESAGAEPGPVCYGRGGRRATLTDANLVLGYLDPASFADGRIRLDRGAAERATGERIGEPLGLGVAAAAWGVHRIANANMERALRSMSIERGRDPRDYALVAFGGAGPLHACELARALGIPRVIVPRGAGVASAIGLLEAERTLTVSRTRTIRLDAPGTPGDLAGLFAGLETRVRGLVGAAGRPVGAWQRHAHVRYAGQGFELRIPLPPGPIDDEFPKRVREAFDAAYEAQYGYARRDQPAEGTDWFLTGGPGEAAAAETGGGTVADPGGGTAVEPGGSRNAGPGPGRGPDPVPGLDSGSGPGLDPGSGPGSGPGLDPGPGSGSVAEADPDAVPALEDRVRPGPTRAAAGAAAPTDGNPTPADTRRAPGSAPPGPAEPARTVIAWRPKASGGSGSGGEGEGGSEGAWAEWPVYDRAALRAGDRLAGPAIVAERESTTLLPAGDTARVTGRGNLLIEISTRERSR